MTNSERLALALIVLGVLSRMAPHPPNMTAVVGVTLLGAYAIRNGWLAALRASAAVPTGHLDYARVPGLSREMVERLEAAMPATLADAGRIRGITPAALAAILVHARRGADAA